MNVMCIRLTALISLLIGSSIYILWRSDSLIMFGWFDAIGISQIIIGLRDYSAIYASTFPDWFYFSLPHALWTFSGMLFLYSIWGRNSHFERMFWVSIMFSFGVLGELGQLIGVVSGTFNILDLYFNVLFGAIALMFAYYCVQHTFFSRNVA